MYRQLRTMLALFALVALSVGAYTQGMASPPPVQPGKQAPAFSLKTMDGKVLTSRSLRGKVVLLDFFATWCGPCKMATPTMQRLHGKYGKKGLVVIGVNGLEQGDAKKLVTNYRKAHKCTYPISVGNDKLFRAWAIPGVPAFVVIDKNGVVRGMNAGYSKPWLELVERELPGLLKAKP